MPLVTYAQAQEITGKSKRTIQRAVNAGRLSYTETLEDSKQVKYFDEYELIALFGALSPASPMTMSVTNNDLTSTISDAILQAQAPLLEQMKKQQTQIKDLTALIQELTKTIAKSTPATIQIEPVQSAEPEKTTEISKKTDNNMSDGDKIWDVMESRGYLDDIPTFGQ